MFAMLNQIGAVLGIPRVSLIHRDLVLAGRDDAPAANHSLATS
jgi:hypothetical protein